MEIGKKDKVVNFRLPLDEYENFKLQCDSEISFSELCRKALGGVSIIKLRPRNEALDRSRIHIIGRHGNNLNQLAHRLNSAALAGEINDTLAAQILHEISAMNEMIVHELAIEKDKYLKD
ncbi:hypothetical protein JCM19233_6148 [Vibrio astriarenae]|nr:hypothetical protein JCM19233_6148 [Vibrio sp. C7]